MPTGWIEGDLTPVELSTRWLESSWTVYYVIWKQLNYQLGDLNLDEGWFKILAVY